MTQTGMTLKQFAAARFRDALAEYAEALRSKDTQRVMLASIAVYCARRNQADRSAINRVFKAGGVQ